MSIWTERVHVDTIKPLANCGNLKGFATVKIGQDPAAPTMIINGVRIVQQPGQQAWVSMPQTEKNGKYFNVVWVTPDLKEAISSAVLGEYMKAMA